jgi:hypothetical protein
MSIFIKNQNCDCPQCASGPCDPDIGPGFVNPPSSGFTVCPKIGEAFYFAIETIRPATSYTAGIYPTGGLPEGISFNTSTGVFTGYPTVKREVFITITATNSCGTSTSSIYYDMISEFTMTASGRCYSSTSGLTPRANGVSEVVFLDVTNSTYSTFNRCSYEHTLELYIPVNSSFQLELDGNIVYSSGCVTLSESPYRYYIGNFTIPVGTVNVRMIATAGCEDLNDGCQDGYYYIYPVT